MRSADGIHGTTFAAPPTHDPGTAMTEREGVIPSRDGRQGDRGNGYGQQSGQSRVHDTGWIGAPPPPQEGFNGAGSGQGYDL